MRIQKCAKKKYWNQLGGSEPKIDRQLLVSGQPSAFLIGMLFAYCISVDIIIAI